MSSLNGKVAVVTGASKGIGAAIAKDLAAAGASVVVNYSSSRDGAEKAVNEIKSKGGKAIAVGANVIQAEDRKRLFAEAKKAFGTIDILVNNAGIYHFNPLEDVTEEDFHKQFDTNVLGLILATQEAVKYFGPQGGSVINIGSVASSLTPPASVVYSATKGAVDAVTGVLAKELGPRNIRVNSINPGVVDTEGFRTAGLKDSDFEKQAVARTPLGRAGQPRDISQIAVFLASPESAWMTGELLEAAGGFR
ncbi:MAG TPA: glucose 1-dehydrogenase [Terriglobales bacterium]|jgi:3-oxoacyl-[acyl-carrier protein] reductase